MPTGVTYGAGLRNEQFRAGTRHQVDAIVLSTSPISDSRNAPTTPVRWRDASGRPRFGIVSRSSVDRPGLRRQIWLDATGKATTHPRTRALTAIETISASLGALGVLGILFAVVHALVNRRLDRRRVAAWEHDWTTVAPHWTGRA